MTKKELLNKIYKAIQTEETFVSKFLKMFQKKILEETNLVEKKKEEINELYHQLYEDSKNHLAVFENLRQLILNSNKDEF